MSRYYFNVNDGQDRPDYDGSELPDLMTARNEAIGLAGSLIKDHGGKFWTDGHWHMEVTNDIGLVLFRLDFTATSSPATRF